VMNTHSRSQINQQARVQPELVIQPHPNPGVQNNSQPPPFPPPGGGDQAHTAVFVARSKP